MLLCHDWSNGVLKTNKVTLPLLCVPLSFSLL